MSGRREPERHQAEIDEAAEWGALKQSLLDGDTLRGLLLYGYAFATIGTIAGIAAFVSFGAAALLLVLVLLGLSTHVGSSTLSGTPSRRAWLSTSEQ